MVLLSKFVNVFVNVFGQKRKILAVEDKPRDMSQWLQKKFDEEKILIYQQLRCLYDDVLLGSISMQDFRKTFEEYIQKDVKFRYFSKHDHDDDKQKFILFINFVCHHGYNKNVFARYFYEDAGEIMFKAYLSYYL